MYVARNPTNGNQKIGGEKIMKKITAFVLTLLLLIATTPAALANNIGLILIYDGCVSWKENETKNLAQYRICDGDVYVNGVKEHDDGSGESTLVINYGAKPVSIRAPYKAGEVRFDPTTSLETLKYQLAVREFEKIESYDSGKTWHFQFHTIRFVVFDENGVKLDNELLTRTEFYKK